MTDHVSTFEIDVWFADGKADGPVAEHVGACVRCSGYVEELEALAAQPFAIAPPTPVTSRLRRAAPFVGALALAAAVALFIRSRPRDDSADYVGVKGTPAVQVLVRSRGVTRIWDGRFPIRHGDALAIRVACEHLAHVTIATPAGAGLARLSDGSCPEKPGTLPFTLVVDDQPGREQFSVVLTKTRVDDQKLGELVRSNAHEGDAWVASFELPKEVER